MQENIKGIRFCHTLKTGGQETYPFYSNSLFETNLTEAEYSSHPSPLVSPSAIPSTVPLRCALCAGKTYRYGTVRYRRRWCMEARRLKAFCDKYSPDTAVRFSTMKYINQEWMENVTSGEYQRYYKEMYSK